MKIAACCFCMLCGCATPIDTTHVNTLYGEYQAACMAAEMDKQYTYECVHATYDLCREWYRINRIVWFSHVIGPRDRNGDPTSMAEMRYAINTNGCHARLL